MRTSRSDGASQRQENRAAVDNETASLVWEAIVVARGRSAADHRADIALRRPPTPIATGIAIAIAAMGR